MYVMIWAYQVKADCVAEFEKSYGEDGAWVELFKNGNGFLGTELLSDLRDRYRYITIDRWVSSEAYNSFQAKWQDEYKALDERCKSLTDSESFLGTFSTAHPGG
jgi:heme-degrading monooxygenase HmoA